MEDHGRSGSAGQYELGILPLVAAQMIAVHDRRFAYRPKGLFHHRVLAGGHDERKRERRQLFVDRRWTVLARSENHLSGRAQGSWPESLRIFVLLSKRGQSVAARRFIVLLEFAGEAETQFVRQGRSGLRSVRGSRRLDGNLRAEHENAVAMPERTDQIIPVPLFHSSSTGNSATAMLNPASPSGARPNLGWLHFS